MDAQYIKTWINTHKHTFTHVNLQYIVSSNCFNMYNETFIGQVVAIKSRPTYTDGQLTENK